MQVSKEEFKKMQKTWKNQNEILEMQSSILQIKTSIESLATRLKQVEYRVWDIKDKVDKLDQSKRMKNVKKIWMKYVKPLGHHWKTNLWIIVTEKGEEIQTKGIYNLFNNVIAENFTNLKKGKGIQVWRFSEDQTGRIKKKTYIIKILNIQNKDLESCKREMTSCM
jgi:hypothetical protein